MTDATRVTPRLSRSARRAQLVAAAKTVFVTQGYHAAAMDDIAETAGVSKPVLYQHFPSKLELYLALLSESADEMVRLVRAALDATTDNHDRVDGAAGRLLHLRGGQRRGLPADLRVGSARPAEGRARSSSAPPTTASPRSPTPSRPTPGSTSSVRGCWRPAWSGSRRSAPATGCSSRRMSPGRRRWNCCRRSMWRGISRFPRQERSAEASAGAELDFGRTVPGATPSTRVAETHPSHVGRRDLDVSDLARTAR